MLNGDDKLKCYEKTKNAWAQVEVKNFSVIIPYFWSQNREKSGFIDFYQIYSFWAWIRT